MPKYSELTEIIEQQLRIKISNKEDAVDLKKALENVINPGQSYSFPQRFLKDMYFIFDLIRAPEDYLNTTIPYGDFKEVFINSIRAKILSLFPSLPNMPLPPQLNYVQNLTKEMWISKLESLFNVGAEVDNDEDDDSEDDSEVESKEIVKSLPLATISEEGEPEVNSSNFFNKH